MEKIKEEITKAQDMDTLRGALIALCQKLSCDFIFYNIQITNSFEEALFLGVGNYPIKWLERYQKNDYAKIDPVLKHCLEKEEVIFWKACQGREDERVEKFFQEAASFGLADGVSQGMRKSQSEIGVWSIATKESLPQNDIVFLMTEIQPLIHESIIRLSSTYKKSKSDLLTSREHEALQLMVEGKTSAQIAKALYISESTATFHIKNIIEKLDAKNRIQAVARAVLIGLVSPVDYHDRQVHSYVFKDV